MVELMFWATDCLKGVTLQRVYPACQCLVVTGFDCCRVAEVREDDHQSQSSFMAK